MSDEHSVNLDSLIEATHWEIYFNKIAGGYRVELYGSPGDEVVASRYDEDTKTVHLDIRLNKGATAGLSTVERDLCIPRDTVAIVVDDIDAYGYCPPPAEFDRHNPHNHIK